MTKRVIELALRPALFVGVAGAGLAQGGADGIVTATASRNGDQVSAAITAFQGACGGCHTPFRGPGAEA